MGDILAGYGRIGVDDQLVTLTMPHHGMSIGSDLATDLAEVIVHGEGNAERHD
jgi:hypothetical protein